MQELAAKQVVSKQQLDAAQAAADAARAQRRRARSADAARPARASPTREAGVRLAQARLAGGAGGARQRGAAALLHAGHGAGGGHRLAQAGRARASSCRRASRCSRSCPTRACGSRRTSRRRSSSDLKVGQPVEIEVDAYGGCTAKGKVESVSAATGAKFALLPPDNATGNFTKVVQRVPVRIAITQGLRQGSAAASGHVGRRRTSTRSKPQRRASRMIDAPIRAPAARPARRPTVHGPPSGAIVAAEDKYKYKYLIAIAVTLAAVLELIDTSIVNVAIPHMMGNLGATLDEISWVSTGYIIANVIVIPMSGWLSAYFGRKRYLTGSIMLFVVASFFCGAATLARRLDLLARRAGARRRRAAVHRAGHAVRGVPAEGSRHRPGDVRRRRDGRPDARPDARRLHRRQLQLALDLLHQRAARHLRGVHGVHVRARLPSIRSARTRSTCTGILLLAIVRRLAAVDARARRALRLVRLAVRDRARRSRRSCRSCC